MTHSITHQVKGGATVEIGVFTHEGREFAALGSVLDETRGMVCAYASGVPGAYTLQTWGGEVIAPLTLVKTWRQSGCFGGFPVRIYAWRAEIKGVTYSGRNAGPQVFLRLRAKV